MPSMIIGLAVLAYGLVVAACMLARLGAGRARRPLAEQRHWLACAFWFAALVAIRVLDIEERSRNALRAVAREENLYADRWMWQVPLTMLAAIGLCTLLVLAVRSYPGLRSRKRLAIWFSRQAVLAYIPLYALRMISLHAIDRLLYAGAFRLNWVLDGMLALTVLLAALFYLRTLRSR